MFLETILADAIHPEEGSRKPPSVLAGLWVNRLGSTMEIEVDDDHRITGGFTAGLGVLDMTAAFPLSGFAEGDAISFCVDFGRLGSVASWSGHHISDEHGERLVTLWHLARPVRDPHGESDVWQAMTAGADEFTRVSD